MGKVYKSKEVIRMLEKQGWYVANVTGSHYKFKHELKPGYVSVPFHNKDLNKATANSILKQAGLK